MKNLLITICLGSMFFSANAMDDFDPVMDTTIFFHLSNNPPVLNNPPVSNNPPVLNNPQPNDDDFDPVMDTTIFFHLSNNPPVLNNPPVSNNPQPNDDDFDPVMDTTIFFHLSNNPPVLNNPPVPNNPPVLNNPPVPNNPQPNSNLLRLNDFVGNINDPITVPVDFPDFPNIVIKVLGDPIDVFSEDQTTVQERTEFWSSVGINDQLTNAQKESIKQDFKKMIINPDGSYDKIIKVEITTALRDDNGNIRKQGPRVFSTTKTLYIPEWFIGQDGTKRFVDNINNLSIDEIADNLTQSCAQKIRDYVFNNVKLFDQILDDRRRKTIKLVAAGGGGNTVLRAFLNVNDNDDFQTFVDTLYNTLIPFEVNIHNYSASNLRYFLEGILPDDKIKCLGGKIALFLKLIKTTGYIENAAYDVIFGEQVDYSGFAVKKDLRQVDVFSAFCEGSRIPDSPSATNEEKRAGNNYAKGLFFRALRLLFGYNEREDTNGIRNFFQVEGPFWQALGRQGNPNNGRSIGSLLNSLFFHCEDIAGPYIDNGSIQFSDSRCRDAVTNKFGNAYVKIVDPEEGLNGFSMAHVDLHYPRDNDDEVLGVSSNRICPPAQSRYIFRAFEKLMDRCEALNGEDRNAVLDEIASIMGVLIQGFNHCDAGVAGAYNEVMNTFISKEEHIEYDVLRYSVMQFAAEGIFSQLFQYKDIKGDKTKEDFIKDGNFNSEATKLFGESTMGVKYVRYLLNGRYGIGTVNNNRYASHDDYYKRRLQVHLLGGRARSTVIRKALGALYNNPITQKWGIDEDSDSCLREIDENEDYTSWRAYADFFASEFQAGDRAFDWVRTDSIGHRIFDYSYYPSWWRPSSDVPENARNMTDEEYNEVITTMLDGVMSDLDLFLDVAVESPLMPKLFDAYLKTCDLIVRRDDNNNANSGIGQENTVDIFSWVAGIDVDRQRELKKKVLFKILKPTMEEELFIERIRH